MNRTLLIADKDLASLSQLATEFSDMGFTATTCTSFGRAVSILKTTIIEFAVVEVRLADKNGLELLREIRDVQPAARVAVFTRYPTFSSALEAGKLGAVSYLCKPASAEEIMRSFGPFQNSTRRSRDENAECLNREPDVRSLQRTVNEQFRQALLSCGGNITQAARMLGVSRRTFHRKIQAIPELQPGSQEATVFREV